MALLGQSDTKFSEGKVLRVYKDASADDDIWLASSCPPSSATPVESLRMPVLVALSDRDPLDIVPASSAACNAMSFNFSKRFGRNGIDVDKETTTAVSPYLNPACYVRDERLNAGQVVNTKRLVSRQATVNSGQMHLFRVNPFSWATTDTEMIGDIVSNVMIGDIVTAVRQNGMNIKPVVADLFKLEWWQKSAEPIGWHLWRTLRPYSPCIDVWKEAKKEQIMVRNCEIVISDEFDISRVEHDVMRW